MTEIRTVSYLLHPPFLDETGLLSALRWYARGFAERSGIKVDLDLPESFERLPLDTETVLFRIVQESLTNIHRHAGSKTAHIRVMVDAETLVLEIEDQGHGIADAELKHITSGGGGVGVGYRQHERTHRAAWRASRGHVESPREERYDRPCVVAAREGRRLTSLRILVVDHHAVVRRNGLDATRQILKAAPDTEVLVLTRDQSLVQDSH
jgi:hypothetical protein